MNWHHNTRTGSWEASDGDWRATVVRLSGSHQWYPYVQRISLPHERSDDPHAQWASDGRLWCEAEMARLSEQASR